MSLSSAYSETTSINVKFKDNTTAVIYIPIPLELTLDMDNPEFTYENVIEFDDKTKSKLQKEFVRNWEKNNLLNVESIEDDWED